MKISLAIVGAPKCGTTALFSALARHPALCLHRQREMTYFFNDSEYEVGADAAYARYFGRHIDRDKTLLMKHVLCMYSPAALDRLREHNEQVKLVIMLRDPVERAYSAFTFARSRGWEPNQTFEAALQRDEALNDQDFSQYRHWMYLYQGLYHRHLDSVWQRFDRDRVFIMLSSDLRQEPEETLRRFARFAGMDPVFEPLSTPSRNVTKVARSQTVARSIAWFLSPGNRLRRLFRRCVPSAVSYKLRHAVYAMNETDRLPPVMDPATRDRLHAYFAEPNAMLARQIDRDLGSWQSAG